MNMKIEDIICELGNGKNVVEVAAGRERFSKRIKEIISDVPVFSLVLHRDYDFNSPLVFDSISDIDEYCQNCDGADGILRCAICGSFVGNFGYYRDNEEEKIYDSLECLVFDFNRRFGRGNWTTMMNDNLEFQVHVKVDGDRTSEYENLIKKDGTYWRKYELEYVSVYESVDIEDELDVCDDDVLV